MDIIKNISEMQRWSNQIRSNDKKIGFVPTMGALHEGHLKLIDDAKKRADRVVVSIFVNPTQFGPKEDFNKYPREEKADLEKCKTRDVDCVFMPEANEMYLKDYQTYVDVKNISKGLCGDKRPGHFTGVATVVLKLFNAVNPDISIFGEKDFQQLQVIRKMVNDLNLPIDIIGYPIVREDDGLAMSSRNKYLNKDERKRALCLSRSIIEAKGLIALGEQNVSKIKKAVKSIIKDANGKIDYVEIVDGEALKPIDKIKPQARLMLAVYIGKTRLIDNDRISV